MNQEEWGISVEPVMEYACTRCGRNPCRCSKERTFQTMKRAAILIVKIMAVWGALLALMTLIAGCDGVPTFSTEPGHPNEEILAAYAQCYYKHKGLEEKYGHLTVVFTDEHRTIDCPESCTDCPETCDQAGWAWAYTPKINIWRKWVRDPQRVNWDLNYTAAHEVIHVSGPMKHDELFWFALGALFQETNNGAICHED